MSQPSAEKVHEWKAQHGNIYTVSDRGTTYVFRALTFAEYDEIIQIERSFGTADAEDAIAGTALLYPEGIKEFDRIPAGVVSALADEILEISGMNTPKAAKEMMEAQRERSGEVRNLMKAFVLATMPAYREEELDALTFAKLAKKVALSEQIMKVNQAAVGMEDNDMKLDIVDPEEEAQRQEAEAEKHAAQKGPGEAGLKDPIAQRLQEALQ